MKITEFFTKDTTYQFNFERDKNIILDLVNNKIPSIFTDKDEFLLSFYIGILASSKGDFDVDLLIKSTGEWELRVVLSDKDSVKIQGGADFTSQIKDLLNNYETLNDFVEKTILTAIGG